MKRLSVIAGWVFGLGMLGLSLFVTLDVVARKFFGFSFKGTDEMGGYVLAVGAGLTFVVALAESAHMRIDVVYAKLPVAARAIIDVLAMTTLAGMAALLVWLGWRTLDESLAYHATAPTPWATPLVWPQAVWLIALAAFLLLTLIVLAQSLRLVLTGRFREANARFGSAAEKTELEAELADLQRRI